MAKHVSHPGNFSSCSLEKFSKKADFQNCFPIEKFCQYQYFVPPYQLFLPVDIDNFFGVVSLLIKIIKF